MNWKLGLIRAWTVFSLIWVGFALIFLTSDILSDYREWRVNLNIDEEVTKSNLNPILPTFCNKARGEKGKDYELIEDKDAIDSFLNDGGLCYYELSVFRRLYPEYNDLSDNDLTKKTYKAVGTPLKNLTWEFTKGLAGYLLIIVSLPSLIFLGGISINWIVKGFKVKK